MKQIILVIALLFTLTVGAVPVKTYYIFVNGQMLRVRTKNPNHQKIMKAWKGKYSKRDKDGRRIKVKNNGPNSSSYNKDFTKIERMPNWKANPNDINDI